MRNNIDYLVTHHFWLFAIFLTVINVLMAKKRAAKSIQANPELAEGYDKLIRGYLFWMNLPWIVMGIGATIGKVPSVWHFFKPKNGNPYVLAWFITLACLWFLGAAWLVFRGGAETLLKYPEITNLKKTQKPITIKLMWGICFMGGLAAMVYMWMNNVPLPLGIG
jgi:hypothetical protein